MIVYTENGAENSTFISGFFDGYNKIISNPVTLILFIFSAIGLLAEINNNHGPLELILEILQQAIDEKHSDFVKSILITLKNVFQFLIKYKIQFLLIMSILPLLIIYKSDSTLIIVFLLTTYAIINKSDILTTYIIIQLVFVYYSVTNTFNKILIVMLVTYLILGHKNFDSIFNRKSSITNLS